MKISKKVFAIVGFVITGAPLGIGVIPSHATPATTTTASADSAVVAAGVPARLASAPAVAQVPARLASAPAVTQVPARLASAPAVEIVSSSDEV